MNHDCKMIVSLTFSRVGLRNLGMWVWAHTLKVYKIFTKVGQGPLAKEETLFQTRRCNKLYSTIHAVLPGAFDYNKSITPKNLFTILGPTKWPSKANHLENVMEFLVEEISPLRGIFFVSPLDSLVSGVFNIWRKLEACLPKCQNP